MNIFWGLLGFVFYFIYDLNQVYCIHSVCKSFFSIGSFWIVFVTIMNLSFPIEHFMGVVGLAFGLIAEIYILFFALNFKDTYVEESFSVCDRGVYALCRHPGLYSFLSIYLGLYWMHPSEGMFWIGIVYNLFNFLYIVFQDVFVFPRLFEGYTEYKKKTPFLWMNKKSIKKCVNDFRGLQ